MSAVMWVNHPHRNQAAVWWAVAFGVLLAVRWPAVSVVEFGAVLGVAAAIDVLEYRLPNALLAMACIAAISGAHDVRGILGVVVGAAVAGLPMLFVRLARGVGMGDVKAAAVIGAQLGVRSFTAPAVAVAVAALLAAGAGALMHRQRLALGPCLWIGWCAAQAAVEMGWR